MEIYNELLINGRPICTFEYLVDELLDLFNEQDNKIFKRRLSERSKYTWGHLFEEPYKEEDREEVAYTFEAEATKLLKCLSIKGFTIEKSKKAYESARKKKIIELNEKLVEFAQNPYNLNPVQLKESLDSIKKEVTTVTRNEYTILMKNLKKEIEKIRKGIDFDLRESPYFELIDIDSHKSVFDFDEDGDGFYSFLVIIFTASIGLPIQLDYTEAQGSGWFDDKSILETIAENRQKILILTEGSTDSKLLALTFELLFPEYLDYYSFLDFDDFKSPGGAPMLTNTLKSLMSAGISNRVIGLYDNDAVASDSLRLLPKNKIPNNFKVMQLPTLDFAKNYPTLGPEGIRKMDINGKACSLELFFGKDIISEGNKYIPIQWKGYQESIKIYQGEILHKTKLQELYKQKVSACLKDRTTISEYDWSAMSDLFETIFNTFN